MANSSARRTLSAWSARLGITAPTPPGAVVAELLAIVEARQPCLAAVG